MPPNTTAPMNEENDSSTSILNQRCLTQPEEASAPQRAAEVIQNRNATDGNFYFIS